MYMRAVTVVFLSFGVLLLSFSRISDASRQRHALEQFELEDLKIFYISAAQCDGRRFSYVSDPKGFLHRVEIGDYMGNAEGKVVDIGAAAIVVVELELKDGVWAENERRLGYADQNDVSEEKN